jgi:hypothetical protein
LDALTAELMASNEYQIAGVLAVVMIGDENTRRDQCVISNADQISHSNVHMIVDLHVSTQFQTTLAKHIQSQVDAACKAMVQIHLCLTSNAAGPTHKAGLGEKKLSVDEVEHQPHRAEWSIPTEDVFEAGGIGVHEIPF